MGAVPRRVFKRLGEKLFYSLIVRGCPLRGASTKPFILLAGNRALHLLCDSELHSHVFVHLAFGTGENDTRSQGLPLG